MFIKIKNNQTDQAPLSNLSDSVQALGTALPIKNINDFTPNYYVQIGQVGEERSEIKQINGTPASGTIPVASLTYPHPVDTPVYSIKYDKIIVLRSTSGTAGSASAIGTVSITPDQEFTQYEDSPGSSTYAYKTQFYNSNLDIVSVESAWILGSGISAYSLAGMRDAVRRRIKNIPGIEDQDIDLFLNEYMELMRNAAIQVNQDYGIGTISFPVSSGTQEYSLGDNNYRTPVRVWVDDGNGTAVYLPINMNEIDPMFDYAWDPRFYQPGEGKIGFIPSKNLVGTASIVCMKADDRLNSDDSEVPLVMRSYITGFLDYATAMCYRQDGKTELADSREKLALNKVDLFKIEIDPRQRVQTTHVENVMDTNFYNDFSSWGF